GPTPPTAPACTTSGPAMWAVGLARRRSRRVETPPPVLPRLDEARADDQAVEGRGARGQHVDRAHPPAAEPVLDDVAGAREEHVRGGGPHDDEVDVLGHEVGALERLVGGPDGEIGRGLALVDDPPLADAAALNDPLVAGLDHPLEIGVAQHALRSVRAHPDDPGTGHSRYPSFPPRATSASSAPLICSFTPAFP